MPYTTTAQTFLDEQLPVFIQGVDLPYQVKFVIEGDDGGTWWADFAKKTVQKTGGLVDVIVRARPRDFMAVIEGRMSPADGLMTGRLKVAGDIAKIAHVMKEVARA